MTEILDFELLHTHSLLITVGSIVMATVILAGTYILLKIISAILRRSMRKRSIPESRQLSLIQLVSYVVWTFGIILGIQHFGLDITLLVASSAALLVGIGLGLQNVFKDFISGIIILIDGTIKAGDVVEIGGWVVKVKEVSLRTASVITREDITVIIPNHKFIEENVVNWSHDVAPTRFELDVGVDYTSNTREVERLLIQCALENEEILKTEGYEPFVRLINFGSSSLDFQLAFWSNNLFRIEKTKSQLRFAILDVFLEHNISIPFTKVMVHQAPTVPPKGT